MFQDRQTAAKDLSQHLKSYLFQSPLIMAIPRGGVVIGKILSEQLKGDLDVILVRKIGAPHNPELAIGAIAESGQFWKTDYLETLQLPQDYLKQEIQKELELIRHRREFYTPHCPPISPHHRTVILVDDGIATGSTIMAAITEIKAHHPKKIVVAIPVAPTDSLTKIETIADEIVCLLEPVDFYAVGQFYQYFPQVSDEEVIALLKR